MRNMISVLLVSFFMAASSHVAVAEPRTVKDRAELSDTVKRLFSKEDCRLISEVSRTEYAPRDLAMIFRFRCKGELASVSAILKKLQIEEGFTLEKVALYPGVKMDNTEPSVDVRFVAIALARVEG